MTPLRLLIATVGGSPQPVVTSVLHWHPQRAIFIVSPQTASSLSAEIIPAIQNGGWAEFDSGRYDCFTIEDPENLSVVVKKLRALDEPVYSWLARGPQASVVVDFTGGTKVMTAALTLVASRWPCRLSYIGGKQRTKDGMGIVLEGAETVITSENPADELAWLAVDSALSLLSQHAYAAAARVLNDAIHKVTDPGRKAELSALVLLSEALAAWDRFDHRNALDSLQKVLRRIHDLEAALGRDLTSRLFPALEALHQHLEQVREAGNAAPSRAVLIDLLANARRRMDEGRWDDAVARLYRAIEAIAQLLLTHQGIPSTAAVPLDSIPEPLRSEFRPGADQDRVRLGLRDAWRLLDSLGHPAAAQFRELGLADPNRSLLTKRNHSILAHGFQSVEKDVAPKLFQAALKLSNLREDELPRLPIQRFPPPPSS
jgi:CRISPR-associated protein (TIGR02710 family)